MRTVGGRDRQSREHIQVAHGFTCAFQYVAVRGGCIEDDVPVVLGPQNLLLGAELAQLLGGKVDTILQDAMHRDGVGQLVL